MFVTEGIAKTSSWEVLVSLTFVDSYIHALYSLKARGNVEFEDLYLLEQMILNPLDLLWKSEGPAFTIVPLTFRIWWQVEDASLLCQEVFRCHTAGPLRQWYDAAGAPCHRPHPGPHAFRNRQAVPFVKFFL